MLLLNISGKKANNPSDMINRHSTDMIRISGNSPFLLQKNRLVKGEKNNRIEGIPMYRCSLSGKGNMAAPAIDSE